MPPHCFERAETSERPRRTIRRVGTIEIVAIVAPAAPGLRAPPRPLGSTQPRPWLEMIVAATNQHVGKTGT